VVDHLTLRFHAASVVEEVRPLTEWDKFVPEAKREALLAYTNYKGHPPLGNEPQP
jgi:hypothetical protein